jgi:hypothetical protein
MRKATGRKPHFTNAQWREGSFRILTSGGFKRCRDAMANEIEAHGEQFINKIEYARRSQIA